ncbi:MAG: LuxR C-terminal-related transcriptional regulator, partial [Anaerolineales bacterium]|nr:LuxR C-terminal-related transcriptional regulator [Anaerolineales bacterium]
HALLAHAAYHRVNANLPPDLSERIRDLAQHAFETRELAYEPANYETAVLALPLLSGDDAIGAIGLAHAGAFSNLAVLQTLARQLVIAVENARLYERVQEKETLRGELLGRVVAAPDGLTEREQEVLKLIADGLSNQEVADKLVISVKTVERHRANILAKLGLHSRTELVKYAIRKGLIQVET